MNCSKVVSMEMKGAKKAILQYEVLRVKGDLAEICVCLETGRHHQIRVQMSHASLPIVGDCKYGWKEAPALHGAGQNIALCSVKINFRHPKTGEKMQFQTEPKNPAFCLLQDGFYGMQ